MIASWMLYALAISVLISVAAFAVERVLVARGRPTRFLWAAATLLSVAWPLGAAVIRLLPLPAPARPVRVLPFTIVVDVAPTGPAAIDWFIVIDRGLVVLWVALSLLFLIRLVRGVALVEQARRAWKRGRVDGVRVRLSENVGPAVVGLRSMDVVLPEWILSLDEPLRAIVLRHEEEHRTARDPYLLFGAAVAVALMPWNAALWFLAQRLRLAIEMDCDARVLRAHPSPERYGMLILTIAQRRSMAPAMFAPMLSEPATNLERRILAMRTTTRKVARMTVIGSSLVAIGVLAFASSLQSAGRSPTVKLPQLMKVIAQQAAPSIPAVRPETIPPKPLKKPTAEKVEFVGVKVDSAVAKTGEVMIARPAYYNPSPRYPSLLKAAGIEGAVVARFRTGANGLPDPQSLAIVSSTRDEFSQAVRDALSHWRGQPNDALQIPFLFVMADKSAKDLESMPGGLPAGAVVITGVPGNNGLEEVSVGGPKRVTDNQTYFEFQVEKAASPRPDNPAARYPDMLRSAHVEGEVLAQFIVDTDGKPNMDTFKVLKSTHELFTQSVKDALPQMSFYPAQVGGRPVKQLIQMPFHFNLTP